MKRYDHFKYGNCYFCVVSHFSVESQQKLEVKSVDLLVPFIHSCFAYHILLCYLFLSAVSE